MRGDALLFCKSLTTMMKGRRFWAVILVALSIFAIESTGASLVERSVSPSGQFVIYGSTPEIRGVISDLAERTKSNLLTLLRRRDAWVTAVVINLQVRASNLPELPASNLRFSQTESGLKLQLDLTLSEDNDSNRIEHELMRAILLEMIYRKQGTMSAGESYVEPPPWLIEGLLGSMPNRDDAPLRRPLNGPTGIASVDQLLRERPALLDVVGRELYRTCSFALVQMLIESENGRAQLGSYIDNLSLASNDPVADLSAAFPAFPANDLDEKWKSKIVSLKVSGRPDLLTFWQTEENLGDALQTKFPSPNDRGTFVSFDELCQKKLTAAQRPALQKFNQELTLLASRANPAFRPIVQEYQQLAEQLALGKNRGVSARLSELKTLRARLSARMTEIDDYMNWFEATQLNTPSGLFDNSVKLQVQERRFHRKTDPLSVYLDAVDQQY